MRQALEVAERALALDPNDNVCHWIVGELAFKCGQVERAITHMDRALALNPNDADVLAVFGFMQCVIGNPDLGFRLMARAAERNPFNPTWYNWINGLCLCIHGKYREGLAELDRHVPANPAVMRLRAFALVKLGRVQEARAQMQDLLALTPDLCARTLEENLIEFQPVMPDLIATLREAGLPD
jgi:Tfp pilus assembly protein PilF